MSITTYTLDKTKRKKARIRARSHIGKIFKKFNHKCNRCGEDDIQWLVLHHKNYEDVHPLENTELLCVECHHKEHSFKYHPPISSGTLTKT